MMVNMDFSIILIIYIIFSSYFFNSSCAQNTDTGTDDYENAMPAVPPPALESCNGVFVSYAFNDREKEFPRVKNASAQAWAFNGTATIINTGKTPIESWEMFIRFQHNEILVAVSGATVVGSDEFPVDASNGTTFAGNTKTDLKTSIETALDYTQIAAEIQISGTQFGVKPPGVPMPKSLKLVEDGYACPKPTLLGKAFMYVCCKKDPKAKARPPKEIAKSFKNRQNGDLSITYDVLQAYSNNYLAQVTMENNHPLGRLDHWNITWEWQNDEFINSIRGAYVPNNDASQCIYSRAGKYYSDMDFSQVVTCDKTPIISDLPPTMANDTKLGKLPYCCKNGTLLPALMDKSKSKSVFQLQVNKLPPHLNRTSFDPPRKWAVKGVVNPDYSCSNPVRVAPSEFPNSNGLPGVTVATASFQIACNITRPKHRQSKCCVSFSAYYNESVIPCNTCACGCTNNQSCSQTADAMLLPPEALLVPFENRTEKALAWAKLKQFPMQNPRPCADNCPVSINWHVNTDYKSGWTARITLFNWDETPFQDWFVAVQMGKAYPGYENVYSFNGTKLDHVNKTIFLQGLKGLNYLMGEVNGTKGQPRVPGKQQSVISFLKKRTPGINVAAGDGFPQRVFFNGEECDLPTRIPLKSRAHRSQFNLFSFCFIITAITLLLSTNLLLY